MNYSIQCDELEDPQHFIDEDVDTFQQDNDDGMFADADMEGDDLDYNIYDVE